MFLYSNNLQHISIRINISIRFNWFVSELIFDESGISFPDSKKQQKYLQIFGISIIDQFLKRLEALILTQSCLSGIMALGVSYFQANNSFEKT